MHKKGHESEKESIKINELTDDASINIAIDTIKIEKQAIIFVNTKRGAESLAEKISLKLNKKNKDKENNKTDNEEQLKKLNELSENILHVLSKPTKQCTRLAAIAKEGIAFHHSGLNSEQRELIEDNFKLGIIKVIVGTTTLSAGVDLPAYRVVIRDLKRFGLWGLQYIPVLEYSQQAGRAGRPSYDDHGEAICVADSDSQKKELKEKYIDGKPEEIISKLAVEPVMRTYILSLIASEFVRTSYELEDFFSKTFYAHQYEDLNKLNQIINKMIEQLQEWGFIEIEGQKNASSDFVSAFKYAYSDDKNREQKLKATLLGKRVSELYLDPYTGNFMIESLKKGLQKIEAQKNNQNSINKENNIHEFGLMHLVCSTLELRPRLRVKTAEYDLMNEEANKAQELILTKIPNIYEDEFDEFLSTIKTTTFFMNWLDEKDEEFLFEKFDVRPGEINAKLNIADWLIYSMEELCKLMKMHSLIKDIAKLRFRLKYGVREELIPLLQLKGIGRARARLMFNNNIKDISAVKSCDLMKLSQLLGKNIALDIKKQVGIELSEDKILVKENKRKGQINLNDYDN